jgi:hypothetical protein
MGDDINTRETRFNFLRITNKDRLSQSASASDFTVGLKNNQAVQQTLELYIHSVSFPNVFPNIDTHNNSLTFGARSLGGATNVQPTITIPPAFYSTAQLLVALKSAMDAAMVPVAGTIDFTQDPLTNLISFQTTNLDGVEFFPSVASSTLAPYIGLINNIVPYTQTGTFDAIPNLAGEKVAYLHSKDIAPSQSELSNGLSVSSFVAIPIDVPYLGIQHYRPSTIETNKLIFNTQTDLTTLNIKLRATDGRILDVGENQEIIIVFKIFH